MTIEEQLKAVILSQHRSVRAFSLLVDLPYSTISTVLKNGIAKSGVNTMIKIFSFLNLDIESIPTGTLTHKSPSTDNLDDSENFLINNYRTLNEEGQEKLLDYADDLCQSGKYKKDCANVVDQEKHA